MFDVRCSMFDVRRWAFGVFLSLMIFTIPLSAGALLANALYKWIANGAVGAPSASGITQPDANFPVFRIDCVPPASAEEIILYDSTDLTNWNPGGYRAGLAAVAAAQQILLVNLWPGGAGPAQIIPANPAQNSICRCFGTFTNLSAISSSGIAISFTLVRVDPNDPTIIYDMSSALIRNQETNQLVTDRVVTASIVSGQLKDVLLNAYVDLCRTDFMLDSNGNPLPRMRYLLTCAALGAPGGLQFSIGGGAPVTSPITFVLDTSNIGQSIKGTFDISKLKPS